MGKPETGSALYEVHVWTRDGHGRQFVERHQFSLLGDAKARHQEALLLHPDAELRKVTWTGCAWHTERLDIDHTPVRDGAARVAEVQAIGKRL